MRDIYQVRLDEDRAMRDAARELVEQDVAFIRGDNAGRSASSRVAEHAKETARNAAERVSGIASDNRGLVSATVTAVLAALALYVFRRPLLALVAEWIGWDQRTESEDHSLVRILKEWISQMFRSEPEG